MLPTNILMVKETPMNEYDDYIVMSIPDYNWQDYYLSGEFIYGED